MQTEYDDDLQSYFTDVEHLRAMFRDFVSEEKLPKRLIVIHGVGGVGKSLLLRMFRLHCKSEKIPVALASGDDAKSALDVTMHWAEDLKKDSIKLSALSKTLDAYRAIQAKVADQAKKSQNRVADIASKVTSKTAETAGSTLLGAAIGSIVPGPGTVIGGTLGGLVSGMSAEALTDWLRGFLSKPDIDLLLDPAKRLSDDFLEDIAKAAERKHVVLLLDTFEQMSALEDWIGEIAQKIHPNVLIVIAGRKFPNWNRVWPDWMMNAQTEELKPMTEDVMRELIHRYYATMRGGDPNPEQVKAIIRFARGLPMVVTSAVQLWVKYGVEDFHSVKAEIVANLVDRLIEGVPSNLIPALEAAAIVRWFDQPILRAVTKQDDVRSVYNELRRFPFVRTRVEGLALHDSVREMIDDNLRVQDSERHSELHERAAMYFEKRLGKVTGKEVEQLELERLYHRIRADEESGIKLFQEIAEELVRYRLVNSLRALLNNANTYPLERENSRLWRDYYNARLLHLTAQKEAAEKIYQMIGNDDYAEPKLQAYALCDWGQMLAGYERLAEEDGVNKAISVLENSLNLAPLDTHLVRSLLQLARVFGYQGKQQERFALHEKAKLFFDQVQDGYGLSSVYAVMNRRYIRMGNWLSLFNTQEQLVALAQNLPESPAIKIKISGESNWGWVLAGRMAETIEKAKESVSLIRSSEDFASLGNVLRDLGLAFGYEERYDEANQNFVESQVIANKINAPILVGSILGFWGAILTRQGKFKEATECFLQSLQIKEKSKDPGIVEPLAWFAKLNEIQRNWEKAENDYQRCLAWKSYEIYYFHSEALTGLIRVKHAQGNIDAIYPLLAEAEHLAQQYEYNDHLASLRLTQGHIAWESQKPEESLNFYQKAMIYALRYNRFLLDEVVSGRSQGTPLRPIIPHCLERGDEGRKILFTLRDWWKTGVNDIGTSRPNTISPIPEGILLLEAEKLGREREPGNGSVQRSILEQIETAL